MFEESLRYPWQDGDGVEALLVGGVLSLFGFLLIPAVLVWGYTLRVVRVVVAGERTEAPQTERERPVPEWTDWGDLFVDGLRVFVVSLVYLLVPVFLLAVTVVAFFIPLAEPVPGWVSLLAVAIGLLTIPLLLLAWYALPAALAAVAVTGHTGAAFSGREVWPVLTDGDYAAAWVLALVVDLLAFVVAFVVAATGIGAILGPFIGFYATLATAYLYGVGYANATREESGGTQAPHAPTV